MTTNDTLTAIAIGLCLLLSLWLAWTCREGGR